MDPLCPRAWTGHLNPFEPFHIDRSGAEQTSLAGPGLCGHDHPFTQLHPLFVFDRLLLQILDRSEQLIDHLLDTRTLDQFGDEPSYFECRDRLLRPIWMLDVIQSVWPLKDANAVTDFDDPYVVGLPIRSDSIVTSSCV